MQDGSAMLNANRAHELRTEGQDDATREMIALAPGEGPAVWFLQNRMVLKATSNLARMLSASQLGITLASLALGALSEETLADHFASWLETTSPVAGLMAWSGMARLLRG